MKIFWIFLIVFGIIIIFAPEILAYLIWWFFIFLGVNILVFFARVKKSKSWENYVKFGNYKIYR